MILVEKTIATTPIYEDLICSCRLLTRIIEWISKDGKLILKFADQNQIKG
jgi:hypothetical protein